MQQRGVTPQARTPSGPTPAGCSSPGTGRLLPGATLPTPSGTPVSLERYSGRRNLVVVLLGAGPKSDDTSRLLSQLAQSRRAIEDEETEPLVVAADDSSASITASTYPFTVLLDHDGAFHRCLDAVDAAGNLAPSVIITDRYREIYHVFRPAESEWPPTAPEVLSWLAFMNIQCPECGAPEW